MLLHSFEDNFMTILGDVEVANVKVGSEVGQLAFGPGFKIDQPEILMLNLTSQEHD